MHRWNGATILMLPKLAERSIPYLRTRTSHTIFAAYRRMYNYLYFIWKASGQRCEDASSLDFRGASMPVALLQNFENV